MELPWTNAEKKWRQYCQTSTTVDITRPWRKTTTKKTPGKLSRPIISMRSSHEKAVRLSVCLSVDTTKPQRKTAINKNLESWVLWKHFLKLHWLWLPTLTLEKIQRYKCGRQTEQDGDGSARESVGHSLHSHRQWGESWKSASVVNAHLMDDPTIWQPGCLLYTSPSPRD